MKILQPVTSQIASLIMTALLGAGSGCATTSLTTWENPNFKGGNFKKFVVFALFPRLDDRLLFEHTMAEYFAAKGVQAVASTDLLPPDETIRTDKLAVDRATHEVHADAILIFSPQENESLVGNTYDPNENYFEAYGTDLDNVQITGGQEVGSQLRLSIRLYDNATDKLVWAAQSETMNTGSLQRATRGLTKRLEKAFLKRGFIVSPKQST